MSLDFDREEFKGFCLTCGVSDLDFFLDRCEKLYELLLAANAKVNLTRIQDKNDFMIKHVADSLAICRYFPEIRAGMNLIDIGCGAGFPSLILATAFPQLQVTAVDSIGKKTAFVEAVGTSLDLNNLSVFTGRSREMNRQGEWQGRFDILTARAVSDLRTLYREARNLLKPTGRFVFFKTPEQAAAELDSLKKISSKHNISWEMTEVFDLPAAGGKRLFVYSGR